MKPYIFIIILIIINHIFAQEDSRNIKLLDTYYGANMLLPGEPSWNPAKPDLDRCSGVWGFVDPSTSNEYAFIGLSNADIDTNPAKYRGARILDVSDPEQIFFIDRKISGEFTMETKTYLASDGYVYGYTANKYRNGNSDVRIVSFANPFDLVEIGVIEVGTNSDIDIVHDLYIYNGVLYLACENNPNGNSNIYMYDLSNGNHANPVRCGEYKVPNTIPHLPFYESIETWVVEVYVKDNRIYAGCSTAGAVVMTFEDYYDQYGMRHIEVIPEQTWPVLYRNVRRERQDPIWNSFRVTHSVKVSDDHRYMYVCDEVVDQDTGLPRAYQQGGVLRLFDISGIENFAPVTEPEIIEQNNFMQPIQLYEVPDDYEQGRIVRTNDQLLELASTDCVSTIHKIYFKDNFAYISYYKKGLRILDISDHENWIEAGYYDANDQTGQNHSFYEGSWGVYPFFDSGTIIVSDHNALRTYKFGEFGSITENTTWNGYKYITGDVVVEENTTLTIQPGTHIKFLNGHKIIVKGILNANGTQQDSIKILSMKNNLGYGIYVEDLTRPSTAEANLNYCSVKGLSNGIESFKGTVNVSNSLIRDCSFGINIIDTYSENVITANQIRRCGVGVYVEDSAPLLIENLVEECTYNGIITVSSAGEYSGNIITNCGIHEENENGGFFALEGSIPILSSENENVYNSFTGNSKFGIRAQSSTTILAGSEDLTYSANTFANNLEQDAQAYENSTIWAMFNYWGLEEPRPEQFYQDAGSEIIFEPFLTSPPMENSVFQLPGTSSDNIDMSFDNINNSNLLIRYFREKNHTALKSLALAAMQNSLSENQISMILSLLHHSSMINRDSTFIQILSNLTFAQNYPNVNLQRQFYKIVNKLEFNKPDDAINICMSLAANNPDSGTEKFALFKLFKISRYYLKDEQSSNVYLRQINQKYSNSVYADIVNLKMMSNSITGSLTKPVSEETNQKLTTMNYSLFSNYPNPFNPFTTISFILPEAVYVNLSVYNIQGQLIKTLVNETKEKGAYNVKFNGSKLASGIYFYRLETDNFIDTKRMLLIK